MASAARILERLRGDQGHLEALVRVAVDDLLERPVDELVDPDWLARRLVEGVQASAADPRTREWIRERVQAGRAQLDGASGSLRPHLDAELLGPLQRLLRRPYVPDPKLVRSLIDHRAARALIRDVLHETLSEYAQQVKVPDKAREAVRRTGFTRSRLGQWAGAASVAAKMVGSEVERRMEGRMRDFVDGAISRSIEICVEHLCDPANARDFGAMRADAVDVLVDVELQTWRVELDKLEPEALIDDLHGMVQALARSDEVARQLRGLLETLVEQSGGRSARDFLAGSGLEETWRPQIEEILLTRSRALVQTPAFSTWLEELVEDEVP